jgi:putative restriction endonuclease
VFDIQDCEKIISELKCEKDIRKYPDNLRRGQFNNGWEDAVIRQQVYSPLTLQRLTWRNLGYRTGKHFGENPVNEVNQIFDLFARQYKAVRVIDHESWQSDVSRWVEKHRKLPDGLSYELISFFGLAFEHTQHPDEAWFGVHEQTVSLVVGGIFLAAINLANPDYGIWVLLDQNPVVIPNVEYKPVKSTQKYDPLTWAHLNDVADVNALLENFEFWKSYSQASDKILNSPIARARSVKFQQGRHKRRLNEFWSNSLDSQHDLAELRDEQQRIEAEGYFNIENLEDARRRGMASIVQRQGQSAFRHKLLIAYGHRCPISGCDAESAIEAAHIFPYYGIQTNHITNGLPLRADIHTLFDLYLLSVQPNTYEIVIAPNLIETCYQEFAGRKLSLPSDKFALPSGDALKKHYENFLQKHNLGD